MLHSFPIPNVSLQRAYASQSWAILHLPPGTWDSAVTGGSTVQESGYLECDSTATASRSARLSTGVIRCLSAGQNYVNIDWSKAAFLACRFVVVAATTNGICRIQWGRTAANDAVNLDDRGFGIRIANLALSGQVHDGTSLATPSLSTTLVATTIYHLLITSDGAGNVEWFLDGASKGTSAAGPSAASTDNSTGLQLTAENGADSASQVLDVGGDMVIGVAQ